MLRNASQAVWGIFLGLLAIGGIVLWFYGAGALSLWVGRSAALGHVVFSLIAGIGLYCARGYCTARSNTAPVIGISFGALVAAIILLLVVIDGTAATKVAAVWLCPAILGWTTGSFIAK